MAAVKLYTSWFCPFAQRAWIGLNYKGITYDYVEQDPYNKSPEWLAINQFGFVPAIVHQGKTVSESHVCLEYIDEAWPTEPYLFPRDPHSRANVRVWLDQISKSLTPPYYRILMMKEEEKRDEAKSEFLKAIKRFTDNMDPTGPFFTGADFGAVDASWAPFAYRIIHVLKFYRDFELPEKGYERYHLWWKEVQEVPAVKSTLVDICDLQESYKRYSDGTAKSAVADAIRKGRTLP